MKTQRGFVSAAVLIAIMLGLVVVGGGAYYVVQQNSPSQTASENFDDLQQSPTQATQSPSKDKQSPTSASPKSAVEIVSLSYPSLTYRINNVEGSNAWLRIIDVPSGLSMWQKAGIEVGTHEINLAGLVPYENLKISLSAGTYRLRLEAFTNSIGKTLAESDTFTVPGTVVAVPTCTIRMVSSGENAATLTWTSKNADEAYTAHSPGKGGSPIILGLKTGKRVSLNGSEVVNVNPLEGYWLVVKNTRGATICRPDGTTYFNSQEEIENPPTMG